MSQSRQGFVMSNNTLFKEISNSNSYKNSSDFETDCRAHMAEHGLPCNEQTMLFNGTYKRYSCEGKRSLPEWYIGSYIDDGLIVTYGSWPKQEKYTFVSFINEPYNPEKNAIRKKQMAEHDEKVAHMEAEEREKAIKELREVWAQASSEPTCEEHSLYITAKGIKPYGIKYGLYKEFPAILIPMEDSDKQLLDLQYIFKNPYGDTPPFLKRFHYKAPKKGNWHTINNEIIKNGDTIYIEEGYATAVSVYEAVHADNIKVISAMDAGNIDACLPILKTNYLKSALILGADNDEAGKTAADKATKLYGCSVIFPQFKDTDVKRKDFNDLHKAYGIEVVKEQLGCLVKTYDLNTITQKFLEKEDLCASFQKEKLPLLMQQYIDDKVNSAKGSLNIHPILIANSLLATISSFVNTHYYTNLIPDRRLYANIWSLSMAPSGSGKSTALVLGSVLAKEKEAEVLQELDMLYNEMRQVSDKEEKKKYEQAIALKSSFNPVISAKCTTEGLLKKLSVQKATIFANEYQAFMSNMEKSYNTDLKSTMTELFDSDGIYTNALSDPEKRIMIKQPYLSICVYSTVEWVKDSYKPDDVASGWLPRFLIYSTNLQPNDDYTAQYSANFKPQNAIRSIFEGIKGDKCFTLSQQAWKNYHEIKVSIDSLRGSYDSKYHPIIDVFVPRWKIYVIKIAMLMQVISDNSSPYITESSLEAALTMVTPAIHSTLHILQTVLNLTEDQRRLKTLLSYIRQQSLSSGGIPVLKSTLLSSGILAGGLKMYNDDLHMLIECGVITELKGSSYLPTFQNLNF